MRIMLSIFIIAFLLVQVQIQALPAAEFPNLMNHVQVVWDNWLLTNKVNIRPTISTDGEVPAFIFCGPFRTAGKDGDCQVSSKSEYKSSSGMTVSSATTLSITARHLSTFNENYSCMSFENKISEFVDVYKKTEQGSSGSDYTISYNCKTSEGPKGPLTMIIVFLVSFVFALLGVGFCGFKLAMRRNQKKGNDYRAYQNPFVAQAGNPQAIAYGGNKVY